MNRNTELHFAELPSVEISRSKFDRSYTHKLTFDAGKLIPIYCDATIMPGDTVKMGLSEVVRMMTPICPVMDNAYMDIYFFFVPHRLVWDNFKKFMGENETAPWVSTYDGKIPKLRAPSDENWSIENHSGWTCGSIADYFGIPTEVDNFEVNALPFRSLGLVWNEFFRDENIMYPQNIIKNDNTLTGMTVGANNEANYSLEKIIRGGDCPPVCKLHDYFTSCLPNSQKSAQPVSIPLSKDKQYLKYESPTEQYDGQNVAIEKYGQDPTGQYKTWKYGTYDGSVMDGSANLYIDLSAATGATVNQLRQAFAIQKFMERDARSGKVA